MADLEPLMMMASETVGVKVGGGTITPPFELEKETGGIALGVKIVSNFELLMTLVSESLDDRKAGTNAGSDMGLGIVNGSASVAAGSGGTNARAADLVPFMIVSPDSIGPVCERHWNAFARKATNPPRSRMELVRAAALTKRLG